MKSLLVVNEGSRQHRLWQSGMWTAVVALILLAPVMLEPFQIGKLNRALVLAIAILGLNLVIGYGGQLALGHSAFMGLGAFVAASMVQDELWDYWMIMPVVVILGFVVGLIVGLPALRVKGLYLALITIAMAAVFPTLANLDVLGITERTGGPNGRKVVEEVEPPSYLDWLPGAGGVRGSNGYKYWLIVLVGAVVWLLVWNMMRSRPGRAIIAIRDNETGAAVSGVNLPLYKTLTFGVSAAIGCLAGLLYAMQTAFVAPQDFTFFLAVDLLIGLVIGGVATMQGGLVGGIFVIFVRDLSKRITIPLGFYELDGEGPLSQATFGLALILFTFFAPGGIVSLARLIRSKLITVRPQPPPGVTIMAAATASSQEPESPQETEPEPS